MVVFSSYTELHGDCSKNNKFLFSFRPIFDMPPGPPPHWISGNTAVFRSNVEERHIRLLELHKKYGKVVRIQLGRPPLYGTDIFSVADPHLCEEVLKSKSYAISKLTQARFQMFVGKNGLISLEGATWKKHRRLIMPLFHSGFLSYALEVITDNTGVLTKKLKDLPDNSSVEVYLLIKNLALDIISEAAFGYDLKVQENPDGKLVKVCLFNDVYVAQKDILLVFISPSKRLLNI